MKRLFIFLCFIFVLGLFACEKSEDLNKIISDGLNTITISKEVTEDINLQKEINYQGYAIKLEWSSDNEALSKDGKVTRGTEDVSCHLTVKGTINDKSGEKTFDVTIKKVELNPLSVFDSITIEEKIKTNISLTRKVLFGGENIDISWHIEKVSTDERASIGDDGKVVFPIEEDAEFNLIASAVINGTKYEKAYPVTLLSLKSICIEASKSINIPKSINDDIELPTSVGDVFIDWDTSNSSILSSTGKCSYVHQPKNIMIEAGFGIDYEEDGEINTYFYDTSYRIQVLPYSLEKRVNLIKDKITLETVVYATINLPSAYSDYDLSFQWSSNKKNIISDNGIITSPTEDTVVTLELTIIDDLDNNNTSKINYDVTVKAITDNEEELDFFNHNIIDYVSKYSQSHLSNLKYNAQGKVVLDDNALTGTYESRVFNTRNFTSLVGSWSCITSPNATIELEISILINGKWSKYYTYGVWGLGKTNTYYNQTDSNTPSKMSVDEIMVTSGSANACKYRVTLKRDSLNTSSPVLSLVCLALEISETGYSYPVDVSNLPKSVDNEIAKLYQYDVPGIGGSICSATTTTMLLKWKGYSFTDKGKTYEHEYIASLVADPGHNSPTYGNWSYNMAVAGAYGDNAYVARMYSWEEVMYHLATVGPMGASIKSSNGEWGYKTSGHLVIIRGYRISDSGAVTVICNDPAVKGVYYEVTLNQFLTCWRGVSYVMEK